MAITITPGYDFGVHEIPTRETLLRQANNVKVTGLSLEDIDATLLGIKTGTTSGTTGASLPAPGWMWADPGGSLWIETDHGPVKLKRGGGGFESVRWGSTLLEETAIPQPGLPYEAVPRNPQAQQSDGIDLGNGASETISMWDQLMIDSGNGSTYHGIMWAAETAATGATYPRLVGRGLTEAFVNGTQTPNDFCCRFPGVVRVLTSVNAWVGAFITVASNVITGSNKEHWYGVMVSPHSGTSSTGNALKGGVFMWKYDQGIWGPGATI